MERLSAALPVAGHTSATWSLALPSVVLTYVTGLVKQQKWTKEQMHHTLFPQMNDIYSNSSFQRNRSLGWKNVGEFCRLMSHLWYLCSLNMSGLLRFQDKKWPKFIDRQLKILQSFSTEKLLARCFGNKGLKGWRDYSQPCLHCLTMFNKTDTFPNELHFRGCGIWGHEYSSKAAE